MATVRILTARAHRLLGPLISQIGKTYLAGEKCILLVPEQFTLQAERQLMDQLRLPGFFDLQVLSPSRLSVRTLAAAGVDERKPLDAAGRQMAVSRAIEKCEKSLSFYKKSSQRRGFVGKAASLLIDMKRGGLTPDGLRAYTETLPAGAARAKLGDLALLYESYEQTLSGRFTDSEDQLHYVAQRLPQSGLMEDQNVYVYGFDTLPEQLMQLLLAIAPLCKSLTVALICDSAQAPDGELYLPIRQGIARFVAKLTERGIPAEQHALPAEPLSCSPAIRHLDEALFAYPARKLSGEQKDVYFATYDTPADEASAIARRILALQAEGVDLDRVTVLYPDENGYGFALSAALSDAGIPFFGEQKLSAALHGLSRFLLGALRAMASDYRSEDIFALLASGYSSLTFEEACRLQNYARENGVNRQKWLKPFTRGDELLRGEMDALREKLIGPLTRCRAALVAAKSASASLDAVYDLLMDCGCYERLKKEEADLLDAGRPVRASQAAQVWKALLSLLDELHALQEGARVPLKSIADRLESGLAALSLAALPPASHMLTLGTLGHSLSTQAQFVFLPGLSDGLLTRKTASLLTEEERAQTQAGTGAFLGVTDESRTMMAQLDLKRAMTLPTVKLYLSCAKAGADGASLRPLSLIGTLENRLFTQLPQTDLPLSALPLSPTQALDELSARLRALSEGEAELPEKWQQIFATLLASPETGAAAARMLRATDHRPKAEPLHGEKARALFGGEMISVSRLEQYAACPFKHFVSYGLRPVPVEDRMVTAQDTGIFYHAAMRAFGQTAMRDKTFPHLTDAETDALSDRAIQPLLPQLMDTAMGDDARGEAVAERVRATVRRSVRAVTRQLAAGQFRLYQTEASFGYEGGLPPIVLSLPDGREVTLRGRIDRIDRYDAPQGVYLRVVDYKSSDNDLEAAKMWWGLQLQLLLYLDAAMAIAPHTHPAGVFYFHVHDPLVPLEEDVQAIVEDELRKRLMLKGITLSDVSVLQAMDGGDIPVVQKNVLDKQGEPSPSAPAYTETQLRALMAHAREVAALLSHAIFCGDIGISPAVVGGEPACDRCDYKDVCGLSPLEDEDALRPIEKLETAELKARLTQAAKASAQ